MANVVEVLRAIPRRRVPALQSCTACIRETHFAQPRNPSAFGIPGSGLRRGARVVGSFAQIAGHHDGQHKQKSQREDGGTNVQGNSQAESVEDGGPGGNRASARIRPQTPGTRETTGNLPNARSFL
jgi:hypothetical protein